jgi:hypothetical protein
MQPPLPQNASVATNRFYSSEQMFCFLNKINIMEERRFGSYLHVMFHQIFLFDVTRHVIRSKVPFF